MLWIDPSSIASCMRSVVTVSGTWAVLLPVLLPGLGRLACHLAEAHVGTTWAGDAGMA